MWSYLLARTILLLELSAHCHAYLVPKLSVQAPQGSAPPRFVVESSPSLLDASTTCLGYRASTDASKASDPLRRHGVNVCRNVTLIDRWITRIGYDLGSRDEVSCSYNSSFTSFKTVWGGRYIFLAGAHKSAIASTTLEVVAEGRTIAYCTGSPDVEFLLEGPKDPDSIGSPVDVGLSLELMVPSHCGRMMYEADLFQVWVNK